MTPEQKWRAEAIKFVVNTSNYMPSELYNWTELDIIRHIERISNKCSYLHMEYIINVKHDTTNKTNS